MYAIILIADFFLKCNSRWQISECDSCQRTNPSIKSPSLDLQPIPVTGLWNLWLIS